MGERAGAESAPEDDEEWMRDAALWAALVQARFHGPLWEETATRLARLGFSCVHAWVGSRTVFQRCRAKGARGLTHPELLGQLTAHEVEELVQDVVARALLDLRRHALSGRGWDPAGGARLSTYFVTACLFAFPTVYRSLCRRLVAHRSAEVLTARTPERAGSRDVADSVAHTDALVAVLAAVESPELRQILWMRAHEYTHAEIATALGDGVSPRRVERLLAAWRAGGGAAS